MINDAADRDWIAKAVVHVEDSLRHLSESFRSDPYEHRVEHSLHVKLYDLLMSYDHLSGWCPIGDGTYRTRLVQKEWPGQKKIAIRGTRATRQTFDLGVLSPERIAALDRQGFAEGRCNPPIAIELGLDYGLSHVEGDLRKFRVNEIAHPYLVHFSRKRTSLARDVEHLLEVQDEARWVFVHLDVESLVMRYSDLDTPKVVEGSYQAPS